MNLYFASDGGVNTDNITRAIQDTFGSSDSAYQVALAKRSEKKYPVLDIDIFDRLHI